MKISANSLCPCGSSKKYKKCCKIFHNGSNPKTALELMKSRYTAYVVGDSKYIIKTTHPSNNEYTEDTSSWSSSIKEFSLNSEFTGLVILDFIEGEEESFVTFNALIKQNGQDASFVEKSKFLKVDGKWLYHSGVIS
ncbi:YchJ family protein [Arcobacter sp. YIC-464]|uniref:YchJ family protein n=1 Tax=Arcobacter sp. YIC-464 TaxID=3376631 RepID=UPI003C29500A